MTNNRDVARFDGIGFKAVTIPIDSSIVYDKTQPNGSASVGLAVTMTTSTQCGLVADGQSIKGKLLRVESDGFAAVQIEGYMRLPGGNAVSWTSKQGEKIVGALGPSSAKGYIRPVATATAAELGHAKGEVQDISDTTNVLVYFGAS